MFKIILIYLAIIIVYDSAHIQCMPQSHAQRWSLDLKNDNNINLNALINITEMNLIDSAVQLPKFESVGSISIVYVNFVSVDSICCA